MPEDPSACTAQFRLPLAHSLLSLVFQRYWVCTGLGTQLVPKLVQFVTGFVTTQDFKLIVYLSDSTKGVTWPLSVTTLAAPPNSPKCL